MLRPPPWPVPALLVWAAAWALFVLLQRSVGLPWAVAAASALGVAGSAWGATWWRRGWIAAGFPLSLAVLGAATLPAWAWLAPLALLLLVYPLNAWRDAPIFPTPPNALRDLPRHAALPPGARVLDAGSGLGDGLIALRAAYPEAQIEGVERSAVLALASRWRCRPWARVRRGDLWDGDWGDCALVYLFQRPESMPRAAMKAKAEMAQGAWLASLEFALPDAVPTAQCTTPGGRTVWLYRLPLQG